MSAVGISSPQPGMIFSVASGVIRAVSLPPSTGTSGSSSPCSMRVGARIVFNRSTPAPARQDREHLPANADRIVRAVERAFDPGAQLLFRGRIAGTVDDAIDVPNWIDASRSLPGGRVAASMAAAAGLARGSFGSLLVDMIDRRLRVLAPCLAAMICAIIPSDRRADDMSRCDAESVISPTASFANVVEIVRRGNPQAGERA